MKNSDKLLFVVALLAFVGGCAAYAFLSPSSESSKLAPDATPKGAPVIAWTDANSKRQEPEGSWKTPEFDLVGGWNYDLFTSPEISWNTKQKKYFAKELPLPPEEVFGLNLVSLGHPKYRLVISTYIAGTKPVPEQTAQGRYAAVLSITDTSESRPQTRVLNFGGADTLPITLSDTTDASGTRVVTFLPESPITIKGTSAKLKAFRITQGKEPSGAFFEKLDATVIDESGRTPREFIIGTSPVSDKDRVEALFSDGSSEWLYSETRVPGRKNIVREVSVRNTPKGAFTFVEGGQEIRVGGDVFRIKSLDISAQEARIEKQSSELDKKTRAPKTTERVLTPER